MTKSTAFLATIIALVAVPSYAAEMVRVDTEVDDDHIIISRKNGDRLLLEKWSVRLSPVVFLGKQFPAEISPLWVTMYFEDREPIKWSVQEDIGRRVQPNIDSRANQEPSVPSRESIIDVQKALAFYGFHLGEPDGVVGTKTHNALLSFQQLEKLPATGDIDHATLVALSTELSRNYSNDADALGIAARLLSVASSALPTSSPTTPRARAAAPATTDILEAHVQGDFSGWDGETVFLLDNGQIWQQATYAYTYHYAFHPKVIIYPVAGGYKMSVDGVSGTIGVRRTK